MIVCGVTILVLLKNAIKKHGGSSPHGQGYNNPMPNKAQVPPRILNSYFTNLSKKFYAIC